MLETLGEPDVRRMAIETSPEQQEALFDAARDMTAQDREEITRYIELDLGTDKRNSPFYLEAMVNIKKILPGIEITPTKLIRDFEAARFSIYSETNKELGMVPVIFKVVSVYPDLQIVGLEKYKKHWAEAVRHLGKGNELYYVIDATALLGLGLSQDEIGLDQARYADLEEALAEAEKSEDVFTYYTIAAGMKFFWPEKDLQISEKMERLMQDKLQKQKQKSWILFLRLAAAMQQLTRAKNPDLAAPQELMPEQRNF